jgi:D-amino peptidase
VSKGFKSILIIADIEGSSGCWSYTASSFLTEQWCNACVEMTRDVDGVVAGLFDAGVKHIIVQDFHRTGYNLLAERIDPRAEIRLGYRRGPVPGIGNPGNAEAVMFLGMHAASGTDGFLPHTLTSRIKRLEVNGRPLAEVELFAASLAPYGVRPIFFSGCPIACAQAREVIAGVDVYPIDKTGEQQKFELVSWRQGLAGAAAESLTNVSTKPYVPGGPFKAVITMRHGAAAAQKIALRWGFDHEGDHVFLQTHTIHELYLDLIRFCYLTPFIEKVLPYTLLWHRLVGRFGLQVVRRRVKRMGLPAPSEYDVF